MAIIQQGQKRDTRVQNLSAIANIVMQALQYKQQQDATAYEQNRQREATAYGKAQQTGYGRDVANLLAPYKQTHETRPTTPAERYSDVLKGMDREQLDSMLAPPKQSFDLYPTADRGEEFDRNLNAQLQRRDAERLRAAMGRVPSERRVPISPRYNIKREQIPGLKAGLLEAGAKRPRNVRMDPQLSGMFGRTGGSGGSRPKLIKIVDDQQRVGFFDPYTLENVGGDPKTTFTASKGVSLADSIAMMTGKRLPTQASVQRKQQLLEANDETILQAVLQAKKMRNYNKVNKAGREKMVERILAEQGFKMPPETRK